LAQKLKMSESKLRRIFRERFGSRRRFRKSPVRYSKDDILYAIHYARKRRISLLHACNYIVAERKVIRRSYEEVKNPARAFYLAVIRFIKASNSNVPQGKRIGKTDIKRALMRSDLSDTEKLLIAMTLDGLLTTSSDLNAHMERALKSLLKRNLLTLRGGRYFITPNLKYRLLGDGLS